MQDSRTNNTELVEISTTMAFYKSYRYIDGKARWIIIDENGIIINKFPKKEDLKTFVYYDEIIHTCPRIKEDGEVCGEPLLPEKRIKEKDKEGNPAGRRICNKCYMYIYHKNENRKKEGRERYLSNRRMGKLDPNSNAYIGDKFQKLACEWKGLNDLNLENNNYQSPIDCIDILTGLKYQVKGSSYHQNYGTWNTDLRTEHNAIRKGFIFESLIFFCTNKDRKIIERIYIFPKDELINRKTIGIYKSPKKSIPWYEQYRIKDEEILKKVNQIWKGITDL